MPPKTFHLYPSAMDARLICAMFCIFAFLKLIRSRRKATHLPPGPKGIGNAHQLSSKDLHLLFDKWGHTYGDVIKVEIPGSLMYVLNTHRSMVELLEGRSRIYSSRPPFVMANLCGWSGGIALLPYGDTLKTCRRLLKKGLSAAAVQTYLPLINRSAALLLESLLEQPNGFVSHFTNSAINVALQIAYGYEGVTEDKGLIAMAVEAMNIFSTATIPGAWLVDTVSPLKFIPAWFPLAGFKRYAQYAHNVVTTANNKPFDEVKRLTSSGAAPSSFTAQLLQTEEMDAELEYCTKWSGFSILTGQFDTTTATLSWFTLAMAKYPDVQAKAQAEIDRVVGRDRLPEISDRDDLPYVNAVMLEVFRWHPPVPLIPHNVTEDDEYHGYFVPAGTQIIANVWSVLHDETVYNHPGRFIPERFTIGDAPSSLDVVFGFGRRACPGMLVAQAQAFVSIACMLATMNINKAKDANGNTIELMEEAMPGTISFPNEFKCSIVPRSSAVEELVRRSAEDARAMPSTATLFTGSS